MEMMIKIFFTLVMFLVVFMLVAAYCAPSEASELNRQSPDTLFMENPHMHQVILKPQEAMAIPSQNARACSGSTCSFNLIKR